MKSKFVIQTKYYYHSKETVEIRKWLRNNIGEPYEDWNTIYNTLDKKLFLYVYKEEHAVLVSLRWS